MKLLLQTLLICVLASAQTAEILRDELAHSAKQYALGGTSVASNATAMSVYTNPALLNQLKQYNFHQVTLFNSFSENRKYPAYSAFDSRNGNEIYASTELNYTDFNFAISGEFKLKDQRFVAAFSRLRAYDSNYFYRELVRKNSPAAEYLMAAQIQEVNSEIFANTIGLSSNFKKLEIGISLAMYNMTEYEEAKEIRLSSEAENAANDYDKDLYLKSFSRVSLELNNTPIAINIGLLYPVIDQLKLGLNFRSGYTAELRGTGISWGYEIPSSLAFGLEYFGSNELAAKFTFDYEFISWGDIEIINNDQGAALLTSYANVHRYKVGMEHRVGEKGTPLRVGASFENLKSDPDVHKTTFTAGTSVDASIFTIDLAMGYSYLSYNEKDLFSDAIWINSDGDPFPDRNGLDTVDQAYLNFMVDIIYNFDF